MTILQAIEAHEVSEAEHHLFASLVCAPALSPYGMVVLSAAATLLSIEASNTGREFPDLVEEFALLVHEAHRSRGIVQRPALRLVGGTQA